MEHAYALDSLPSACLHSTCRAWTEVTQISCEYAHKTTTMLYVYTQLYKLSDFGTHHYAHFKTRAHLNSLGKRLVVVERPRRFRHIL